MLMKYFLSDNAPSLVLGLVLFAGARADSSSSIVKILNYIDTVSGYDELSTCAEQVLSTVVRGEYSGCGDTYALTSYTCFCTDSSSYMSAAISKDVISSCPDSVASSQASSALEVFAAYCEMGVDAGLTTQTVQDATTSTASPADAVAPATATVTITSTPTSGNSNSISSASPSSTTFAIIIGVLLSFFGIVVILGAWFIWRKHKMTIGTSRGLPEQANQPMAGPRGWPQKSMEVPIYGNSRELPSFQRPTEVWTTEHPSEVPAYSNPVELPAGARHGQNLGLSSN